MPVVVSAQKTQLVSVLTVLSKAQRSWLACSKALEIESYLRELKRLCACVGPRFVGGPRTEMRAAAHGNRDLDLPRTKLVGFFRSSYKEERATARICNTAVTGFLYGTHTQSQRWRIWPQTGSTYSPHPSWSPWQCHHLITERDKLEGWLRFRETCLTELRLKFTHITLQTQDSYPIRTLWPSQMIQRSLFWGSYI